MSRQNPDPFDELDGELHGLFMRATADIAPRSDLAAGVQQSLARGGSPRAAGTYGTQRSFPVAAALSAFLVVALLAGVFVWFGPAAANRGHTGAPTQTTGFAPTHAPTAASVPFSVTSVDLAVSPTSIAGEPCGNAATFAYTATFHVPAGTAGGTIQFGYTLNNGRSQTTDTVNVAPGQTSVTYAFSSSGTLPADHTYPGMAIVMVTSPNSVSSPQVKPSGTCVQQGQAAPGPFQVTSISMSDNPTSIAGRSCGTYLVESYVATMQLAPNGPGGTIQFEYTVNNGRGSTPVSIQVAPGQTVARYTFAWMGNLPADHTYPEQGGVVVHSPSEIQSPLLGPSGACS
jgi:hypothetical protein